MMTRRTALAGLAATAAALADDKPAKRKGRVKQSVCAWCFQSAGEKWSLDKVCQVAKSLGCGSVELVGTDAFKTLKKHGLTCAIASNGMPGAPFMTGVNNPRYHEEVIKRTKKAIDDCADAGFPAVIAFTGYKYVKADDPKSGTISLDDGHKNSVKALKELARHAEKKKVTVCLEHLNTRDSSHPMKGHPGYQGDDLDWVASILRKVDSPRVKLLFDVYHVQIMHGDLIRRLEQNKELLGHVHTAGNPGRGELDDTQEINYAAVMKKLVALKYAGYVGQEFIPTRKPLEGLRQAVEVCDV
jgi:sugar phosphate isomerase/epimerase